MSSARTGRQPPAPSSVLHGACSSSAVEIAAVAAKDAAAQANAKLSEATPLVDQAIDPSTRKKLDELAAEAAKVAKPVADEAVVQAKPVVDKAFKFASREGAKLARQGLASVEAGLDAPGGRGGECALCARPLDGMNSTLLN